MLLIEPKESRRPEVWGRGAKNIYETGLGIELSGRRPAQQRRETGADVRGFAARAQSVAADATHARDQSGVRNGKEIRNVCQRARTFAWEDAVANASRPANR
jgi:hypothetical protein